MIDFANGSLFKLQPANVQDIFGDIQPLFVQGENAITAFRGSATSWSSPTSA